ncbi:hypothetical protein F5Y05DRAFT_258337 [Hypoxylon sp. FL0543]|nr:hypothetical protein F5Y05DRAFT_258337 [Hypoxylon sp. FL0543]
MKGSMAGGVLVIIWRFLALGGPACIFSRSSSLATAPFFPTHFSCGTWLLHFCFLCIFASDVVYKYRCIITLLSGLNRAFALPSWRSVFS